MNCTMKNKKIIGPIIILIIWVIFLLKNYWIIGELPGLNLSQNWPIILIIIAIIKMINMKK